MLDISLDLAICCKLLQTWMLSSLIELLAKLVKVYPQTRQINQEFAAFSSGIADTIATSPAEPLVLSRPGVSAMARRYSSSADNSYDLEGGPRDYRCAYRAERFSGFHGEILSYQPAEEYPVLITQLSLKYNVC